MKFYSAFQKLADQKYQILQEENNKLKIDSDSKNQENNNLIKKLRDLEVKSNENNKNADQKLSKFVTEIQFLNQQNILLNEEK